MKHPLPRKEYAKHLKSLKGVCAFCSDRDSLLIKKFRHWGWYFAAFPYRKYHTLLVSKRHVTEFTELRAAELSELKLAIKHIETHYRAKGIVSASSRFGDQFFFAWRSRYDGRAKPSLAHFHLHIYPKFASETNDKMVQRGSWKIDWKAFMEK